MRRGEAGGEGFRGIQRGHAPHNPEGDEGAAPRAGARRRGSVSATR